MIEVPGFIERFGAVAENFKWQFSGRTICAWKDAKFFDPITALLWISRRDYCERHELNIAKAKLGISSEAWDLIMKALYNPDYSDNNCSQIRNLIEKICGLAQEHEAT